jgi:hypothetical protein
MWRGGVGAAYLLPALSSAGASRASPCFRFHLPLIEPDGRISRFNQELGRANGHGGDWHAAISLLRSRISGPTLDGGMSYGQSIRHDKLPPAR